MDLENQRVIKRLAEENGAENLMVVLGATDIEGVEISAETLTAGDPSFAGPLAGVQLGLQVHHILEPEIKATIPPDLYEDKMAMTEMVVDVDAIQRSLQKIRGNAGKTDSDDLGSLTSNDKTH
jgi:betaine reductase